MSRRKEQESKTVKRVRKYWRGIEKVRKKERGTDRE